VDGKPNDYAFRYTPATNGVPATLEVLTCIATHKWSGGEAINQRGTVVGVAMNGGDPPSSGFFWVRGENPILIPGTASANYISDSGRVVGPTDTVPATGYQAIVDADNNSWRPVRTYLPLGGSKIGVYGVNDNGVAVGVSSAASGGDRAIRCPLEPPSIQNLGSLDNTSGSYSGATSIKTSRIVGYSSLLVGGKRGTYEYRAFVYTDAKPSMRDLFGLIDPATIPTGMKPADIQGSPKLNDNGWIGGTVVNAFYNGTSGLYSGRVYILMPK
jgi:hypothetical protein